MPSTGLGTDFALYADCTSTCPMLTNQLQNIAPAALPNPRRRPHPHGLPRSEPRHARGPGGFQVAAPYCRLSLDLRPNEPGQHPTSGSRARGALSAAPRSELQSFNEDCSRRPGWCHSGTNQLCPGRRQRAGQGCGSNIPGMESQPAGWWRTATPMMNPNTDNAATVASTRPISVLARRSATVPNTI